ncbi:hypothetical protein SH2C18_37830 [Clostridium sediminicola]|uniref:DUF624 domain-containing protein n=1 Tax=Clostridium sediminicola TaxID=3114879 RepID=UPI0031F1CBE3
MNKRQFGEGPIFTITNYLYWFLLGNIYFVLLNIPFIFIFITFMLNPQPGFTLFFLLASIPIGPALIALLSSMGKIVREKDINFTKFFFKAYKTNFFEGIFYWLLYIITLTIVYIDIIYVKTNFNSKILLILAQILGVFVVSLGLFIFPIISRFYFKVKDLLRISIKYFIKNIHIALTNLGIVVILGYMVFKISYLMLVIASLICFAIMYLEKGILNDIEENLETIQNDKDEDKDNLLQ